MINTTNTEEKPLKSKNNGLRRALSMLALPLTFMYLEWRLASDCGLASGYHPASALLAGFACGMLCNCVAFAFKNRKAGFAAALILAEIGAFYFCVQFFVNNSYQTFMDPLTIFQGAGGVMDEFGEDLARLIREGVGIIALYHVPVFVLLALYKVWDFTRKDRWTLVYLALAGVVCQSMAAGSTQLDTFAAPKYSYEYVFNDGIRNFGLITSTQRDVVYGAFGKPEKPKKPEGLVTRGSSSNGAPAFHGLNKRDIDFNALAAAETDPAISAVHSYVAAQKATVKNEYTGLFEGKNLIVICAESFAAEAVSEELTPTLYKMATEGITFEDYYQPFWGGSTTSGEFATLTGIVPVNHANSMQQIIGHNNASCVGYHLMPLGYTATAYHNGDYDYYNRYLTHPWLGFESFISNGTGMEDYLTDMWPPSDTEMMECTVDDWIDDEKFYVYYMTYSGHSIYNFTHQEQAIKHKDLVESLDASTKIKSYVAAQLELEDAVKIVVDRLEEAGRLDDTLIVLTSDH
ncbi:MAG: LTA synthase family protein, partial [Firmicutes bacterium]|nr:LTA synthase family protein [Bacillota bacterium]